MGKINEASKYENELMQNYYDMLGVFNDIITDMKKRGVNDKIVKALNKLVNMIDNSIQRTFDIMRKAGEEYSVSEAKVARVKKLLKEEYDEENDYDAETDFGGLYGLNILYDRTPDSTDADQPFVIEIVDDEGYEVDNMFVLWLTEDDIINILNIFGKTVDIEQVKEDGVFMISDVGTLEEIQDAIEDAGYRWI